MKGFTKRVKSILSSERFFVVVVCFFIFEAVWIALSAAYPQAFDENFHFGLIQTYSHYWLPFLKNQPPDANAYGAVARDPSFLYHYLMSFPYRVVASFYHEVIGQIIILRLINVGFMAVGLILFRKILIKVGISKPLSNLIILIFALIPIVPQLAAQINYDNLLFPLIAWVILLTFDVIDQIRTKKPSAKTFLTLITVCLFASLVKYAFLPIFLANIIFLSILSYRYYKKDFKRLFVGLYRSWKKLSPYLKLLFVLLLIISSIMFIERDVVNVIRYHSIDPSCSKVLTVNQCSAYGPWEYNYVSHQVLESQLKNGAHVIGNPIYYSLEWTYWMWYRLFFAVNGPISSFTNYPPLPLPSATAIILVIFGGILLIKYWREIFKNNIYLLLLFFASIFYIFVLFLQGYSSYHYTGILENMNGRYLLPVLIMLAAVVARSFSVALRKSENSKAILACGILILFLQGGGLFTFIDRSDDSWDLSNTAVQKVNDTARKITTPVIIDGKKVYYTSYWFFN